MVKKIVLLMADLAWKAADCMGTSIRNCVLIILTIRQRFFIANFILYGCAISQKWLKTLFLKSSELLILFYFVHSLFSSCNASRSGCRTRTAVSNRTLPQNLRPRVRIQWHDLQQRLHI